MTNLIAGTKFFSTILVIFPLLFCIGLSQSAVAQNDSFQQKKWIKLAPTGARAKFEMPIKPRYVERSFSPIQDEPPVKVRLHLATTNAGTTTFIFGYHDLHKTPADAKTINAALDGAVRGSVGNVLGQLVGPQRRILHARTYHGREFEYQFIQGEKLFQVMAHVFLVGNRQYQLSAVMEKDLFQKPYVEKFLKSFQLIVIEDDAPPRPRDKK